MSDEFIPVSVDASLDDIDDLPSFKVFPSGAFVCEVSATEASKIINEHPSSEISLKLIEVSELSEALREGENEPVPGDIQSIAFMRDNAVGAGKLKEFLLPFSKALNKKGPIGELLSDIKGMKILLIQTRNHNKEKDRDFPVIKSVIIL